MQALGEADAVGVPLEGGAADVLHRRGREALREEMVQVSAEDCLEEPLLLQPLDEVLRGGVRALLDGGEFVSRVDAKKGY